MNRLPYEYANQMKRMSFDAVVIGASLSGCITALDLAQKNWRVAVIEQRADPDSYKSLCTHIIHPAGVRLLDRLDVLDRANLPSLQPTAMQIHHQSKVAWFPFGAKTTAANIERRDLDPALKKLLSKEARITFIPGCKMTSLLSQDGRIKGIECQQQGTTLQLEAPLVIGADGRNSNTAKLANSQVFCQNNGRIALFQYFSFPESQAATQHESGFTQVWAQDRGKRYVSYFPNQERVLVSLYLSRDELDALNGDKQACFEKAMRLLAQQGIELGQPEGKVTLVNETSPLHRKTHLQGLVLVGDALLAADPLTGVGCTWAMQSAEHLVRSLPTLVSSRQNPTQVQIERALRRYQLKHMLLFRVPSAIMTLMSTRGHWIFNRPIFGLFSWLSRSSSNTH